MEESIKKEMEELFYDSFMFGESMVRINPDATIERIEPFSKEYEEVRIKLLEDGTL